MKKYIRAFGIAFFLIGAIMVIGEKFELPYISQKPSTDNKEVSRLEEQLKYANKQIEDLEKTIEEQKAINENTADSKTKAEESNTTKTTHKASDTSKEDSKKEEPVKATLYVYEGLTPSEIADKLKDLKIIKNSVEMELFLAQKEYKTSIQIGQYELNSDMTVEEIANIITDKE